MEKQADIRICFKAGMEKAISLLTGWMPVAEFDFKKHMDDTLYLFDGLQCIIGYVNNRGNFFVKGNSNFYATHIHCLPEPPNEVDFNSRITQNKLI